MQAIAPFAGRVVRAFLGIALLSWPSVGAAEPDPTAPSSVAKSKAMQTFREGIEAFDRRDFEAARVAFLQTFALRPSEPVVRRNLGLAEIYSGHYLDGARRLSRVLHTTSEGNAEARSRMLESLEIAEAHLQRLTIEVDVSGADIVIAGIDLGPSPLSFAWYLPPGAYEVSIGKPGYETHVEQRLARAGGREHLRVRLVPQVEPETAADSPGELSPPGVDLQGGVEPKLNAWWVVAGASLTAAGVVGGVVFSMAASDSESEANSLAAGVDSPPGCAPPAHPNCDGIERALARHDSQQLWSLVSFSVAAVSGVSTLVYGLVAATGSPAPLTSVDRAASVGWGLDFGRGRGSVSLRGAF